METIKDDYSIICQKAINTFGIEAQTRQLMEECGELIRAANHFYRSGGRCKEDVGNFIEEMADVFIMINQFSCYFHLVDEINEVVENKMLILSAKLESIDKTNMMDDLP